MSTNLLIISILFSIFIIVFILGLVYKKKIKVKYALVWLILFFVLFLALIIPGFLESLTKLFGFQVSGNLVLSIIVGLLVIISIITTVIISGQNNSIRELTQELAILKKEIDNKKEK